MMGLLQSSLITALPWLIASTGLSAGWWSVAMAAGMLPVVMGAPVWGQQADRRGSFWVLRGASSLVLLAFPLLLLVLIWQPAAIMLMVLVVLIRLLHGIGAGGVFPAAQRLVVSGVDPGQWAARLAGLQVAVHLGRLAGPGLMVVAAVSGVPGALALVWMVGVLCCLTLARPAEELPFRAGQQSQVLRPGWRDGLPLYAMALAITVWVGILQFVLGPVLARVSGSSPETATALTGTALVIASVAAMMAGPLVHHHVRSVVWLGALWSLGIGAGGIQLALASSVMDIYLGVALLAMGVAVITPWYGAVLRQLWPQARGQVAGRLTSLHTFGYGVGTLIGGALLEWSPDQALAVFPVLVLVVAALALWAGKRGLPVE